FKTDLRHMNTDSDSEVLLNVFAHELQKRGKLEPAAEDIFHAVTRVHERCKGAYGVVAMVTGQGIVGFRDPHGIRPLIYGSRETDEGMEYIIASESVASTALGFKVERDLAPGEAIFIDSNGQMFTQQCAAQSEYHPCIFEYVYFARPDATIDGISVYK
ncbi:amidophosphoribosyltransferase, partial [Escherichia coli]